MSEPQHDPCKRCSSDQQRKAMQPVKTPYRRAWRREGHRFTHVPSISDRRWSRSASQLFSGTRRYCRMAICGGTTRSAQLKAAGVNTHSDASCTRTPLEAHRVSYRLNAGCGMSRVSPGLSSTVMARSRAPLHPLAMTTSCTATQATPGQCWRSIGVGTRIATHILSQRRLARCRRVGSDRAACLHVASRVDVPVVLARPATAAAAASTGRDTPLHTTPAPFGSCTCAASRQRCVQRPRKHRRCVKVPEHGRVPQRQRDVRLGKRGLAQPLHNLADGVVRAACRHRRRDHRPATIRATSA